MLLPTIVITGAASTVIPLASKMPAGTNAAWVFLQAKAGNVGVVYHGGPSVKSDGSDGAGLAAGATFVYGPFCGNAVNAEGLNFNFSNTGDVLFVRIVQL